MKVTLHSTKFGSIYSEANGTMYWSQSSLGKAAGTDATRVRRAIINGVIINEISAEILTQQGVRNGVIIPAVGAGAGKFIAKHNPELSETLQDIGTTVFLQQLADLRQETGAVKEQIADAYRIIRNFHRHVWFKNITPNEGIKLHMMYFGMTVKEHKALLPAFAQLTDEERSDSLLPDLCSLRQLEEITNLRAAFVKAKKQSYGDPYVEAIAAMK